MSKTSLNAKCGIELKALVPFNMSLPMNWDILGSFCSTRCPSEINILKLEQLNHQMAICFYKGDLTGYETGSSTLMVIFVFLAAGLVDMKFRIPEFFKCLKY